MGPQNKYKAQFVGAGNFTSHIIFLLQNCLGIHRRALKYDVCMKTNLFEDYTATKVLREALDRRTRNFSGCFARIKSQAKIIWKEMEKQHRGMWRRGSKRK